MDVVVVVLIGGDGGKENVHRIICLPEREEEVSSSRARSGKRHAVFRLVRRG